MNELMEAQPGFDMSKPAAVFSQSSIEVDGFPILYGEAGQGDALVCLQDGGLRLSKAHELMAQRRHLIAFETPGVGRPLTRATSLTDLVHKMHAAVSSIGIDRFSIMANSYAAELALRMAIAQPKQVQAVVLLAPAAIRTERLAPRISSEMGAAMHPAAASDDEFEVSLANLETPVLALIGTDNHVTSSAAVQVYRDKLRNFHLVMVYGTGDAIDAERPEAVAALVDDFLTRGESFIVRNKSDIIYP